ncbi:Putative LOC100869307 [Caligus rogercresseyi]|uniref:LOC100869307 n=1 Tax=Caligus rogercresseyi TaxID=217165 RepID=A0A7T8KCU8_CALRO|nr:Putative LOC100869307 [Caligus rogercresseyi]
MCRTFHLTFMYNCLKCSYSSLRHLNVKRHIEARHFLTDGFKCSKCSGVFKTRETRSKHFLKQHKGDPVYYSTAHFDVKAISVGIMPAKSTPAILFGLLCCSLILRVRKKIFT